MGERGYEVGTIRTSRGPHGLSTTALLFLLLLAGLLYEQGRSVSNRENMVATRNERGARHVGTHSPSASLSPPKSSSSLSSLYTLFFVALVARFLVVAEGKTSTAVSVSMSASSSS